MRLATNTRGFPRIDGLQQHVERRVQFALARFADRVRALDVLVEDVNGPRGGIDIRCRLVAVIAPAERIVVEETRDNPFAAVSRAVERLKRAVGRAHDRRRDRRRRERRLRRA